MATPATLRHLTVLQKEMHEEFANVQKEMATKRELKEAVTEMKLYFDFSVEQIKDAVKTINMEKIKEHDVRITRLEVHTGLPRAA